MYGVLGTITGIEDKFLISAGTTQQALHNKNNTHDFNKKIIMFETGKQYVYCLFKDSVLARISIIMCKEIIMKIMEIKAILKIIDSIKNSQ